MNKNKENSYTYAADVRKQICDEYELGNIPQWKLQEKYNISRSTLQRYLHTYRKGDIA